MEKNEIIQDLNSVKYIITSSISQEKFKKQTFKFFNSLEEVVSDPSNAENFYILKVIEETNTIKKAFVKTGLAKAKKLNNYYYDAEKKVIKILDKVKLKEMIASGVTTEYLFNYAIMHNSNKIRNGLKKQSLNIILDFLIQECIDVNLLITFCIKIPDCDMSKAENYILSQLIIQKDKTLTTKNIDMLTQFTNKVSTCNIDRILDSIINLDNINLLIEFINNVEKCDLNKALRHIANEDSSPHGTAFLKSVKRITNSSLDFNLVEDIIIEKDKKGNLIYNLAKEYNEKCDINKLSKAIIEIDKHGYISLMFASHIKNVDKKYFETEIAKKDKIGTYCISLANEENSNKEMLLDRVLELDKNNGAMVLEFAKNANGVINTKKIEDYILKHDTDGKVLIELAQIENKGFNIEKIQEHIINLDTDGKLSYLFALNVAKCDIGILEKRVKELDNDGKYCYLFITKIKDSNKTELIQKLIEIDKTGNILKELLSMGNSIISIQDETEIKKALYQIQQ